MNLRYYFYCTALITLFFISPILSQSYKVIESNPNYITIEFNFNTQQYILVDTTINGKVFQLIKGNDNYYRKPGEPWVPKIDLNIGVPFGAEPTIKILKNKKLVERNKFIAPFPETDPEFEAPDFSKIDVTVYSKNQPFPKQVAEFEEDYIFRYSRILALSVSPYQFNPVTRELIFNYSFTVRIDYNVSGQTGRVPVNDKFTASYLKNAVINFDQAKNWIGKDVNPANNPMEDGYWYDPNKNYFKLYLTEKGVYRVTYNEFVNAGAPLGFSTPIDKLEIINNGESIPIDVVDNNNDGFFNDNDYLQFVGYPPPPTANSFLNIYNESNVYWFSYQSDSTGNQYRDISGYPYSWDNTLYSSRATIHYEEDKIYERLGYSSSSEVDHWFWGKATAFNGNAQIGFEDFFPGFAGHIVDSNYVTIRVGLHGITNRSYCNPEHKANIFITDQYIGTAIWDAQEPYVFEKQFYVSEDSIRIFPTGNRLNVFVNGDICPNTDNDEIRVNWYEFEYWKKNKAQENHFSFKSYLAGVNRIWITNWLRNNMKIYIPERNKLIKNPLITGDQSNSVIFVDTSNVGTEYFLVSNDYFLTVDSIVEDTPSNLRDISNGADYIIITHPDFMQSAQELAQYRSTYLPDPDIQNPRVKVVDVLQIYDEFSYGLLDPYAIKEFIKYAFNNWQEPAPSYVVLFGDMSYDYRGVLEDGRPNFIPSIPYFAYTYGEAVSDNAFVAVAGSDIAPDLAIGRISCETPQEADILVQKIKNYPDDPTKPWRETIILLASGLDPDDENNFGFNDASLLLGNTYLVGNGYRPKYVFNFPTKPEHEPYQGGQVEMREAINTGAIMVNYYGHGGGLQWDLVFSDDDIDLLENEGRLPVVISVTCYTAHFDNQRVFGEHFNLVENSGSIGFFGSSGLTYWGIGKAINNKIFDEVFNKKVFSIGKAILNAKNRVPASGVYGTQVALLTYLGDPAVSMAIPKYPDFSISPSDITITPPNPLVNDTVTVKVNVHNWGRMFHTDSVTVQLFVSSSDTNYLAGSKRLDGFADEDSVYFTWIPTQGDLFQLTAAINQADSISEVDHSDNVASQYFLVFNISEPNVLDPIDGFSTSSSSVEFVFSDIGHYLHRDLTYYIEIDTSLSFEQPIASSGALTTNEVLVRWNSPELPQGTYFWRARIFTGSEYGNWSEVRSFSIMNNPKNGYYAHEAILKTFNTYNITYSDSSGALRLNTDFLPPRPSDETFLGDIVPGVTLPDSLRLTTITTDGTYIYFGNIWFLMLPFNQDGKSAIYKIGTGRNGTVKGAFYGKLSTFYDKILNSIVYFDGYVYVATGQSHQLTRINVATDEIDTVAVPPGMLRWDNSIPADGPVYLTADDKYFYNLTLIKPNGDRKYTLRVFDPNNGFSLVRADMVLSGSSFEGFSGFFVYGDYLYPVETFLTNYIRRIRISDGFFEEEWIVRTDFQSYYAWCVDWENNEVYASVYRGGAGYPPKFSRFMGEYIDASGSINTKAVGPVAWWNSLSYDIYNPSPTGQYSVNLLGLNFFTGQWDTVALNVPNPYSLSDVDPKTYQKLSLNITLTDSSLNGVNPMELKSINFDYHPRPDVYFERDDMQFSPDSVMQGFPITMSFRARNYGDIDIDSLNIDFELIDVSVDSTVQSFSRVISVPADSVSDAITYTVNTEQLLFENKMQAFGVTDQLEYFGFDNLIDNSFYVVRDSVRPAFSIAFDGKEIINGDIVSAQPDVLITLEDNSPLPLKQEYFTIIYNNEPLTFEDSSLTFSYTPYPNSRAEIHWRPKLKDGKHTLEILAKDASGNFFDSTSSRTIFYVFNESDITEVYNYPNPFTNDTYFTFQLHGTQLPERFYIKIYTIAGRLIRNIEVPPSQLNAGFNKIYWDGKDEDGDDVANGVYLYKVIVQFNDKTKDVTQKLARIR